MFERPTARLQLAATFVRFDLCASSSKHLGLAHHFCARAPMYSRASLAIVLALQLTATTFGHHFRYTANLTGPAESPANDSPAFGHVVVRVDFDINLLTVKATFGDLLGTVTEAHIHAPTPMAGFGTAIAATPIPAFADFPFGVTAGDYEADFDLDLALASSYNPDFITQTGGTVSTAYNTLGVALI